MIIDSHAHIFPGSLEEHERLILGSMEKYGVDFSLISSGEATEIDEERGLPQIEALSHCIYLADKYPSKIGALFWFRPTKETLTEETLAYIKKHKNSIRGMKFHPYTSMMGIDDPKATPYLELAEKMGWPILVHTAVDEHSKIEHLIDAARRFPSVIFIAAHLELFGDHYSCVDKIKDIENIHADTAWVDENVCRYALEKMGPNRVLFGTDNPVDGFDTLANDIYRPYFFKNIGLDEETYDLLMHGNAARIYKIKY